MRTSRLNGKLYFICCVSGETGKHDAIRNVVEKEGVRADIAFVYGNSLKLQLGNRGRVDVKAIVHGTPAHSSRPERRRQRRHRRDGVPAAPRAEIPNDRSHPQLGTAWLTCNRIESLPKSTHTVQDRCEIGLDRRLLPGEDPDAARRRNRARGRSAGRLERSGLRQAAARRRWRKAR